VDLRKHALDERAHWRDLANMIEQFMCGGDMAFLLNHFAHLFLDMQTPVAHRLLLSICISFSLKSAAIHGLF